MRYISVIGLVIAITTPILLSLAFMHDNTPFSPFNTGWDGYSSLAKCIKPSTSVRGFNTVILVVEEEPNSGLINELRSFLNKGGLLVIASNQAEYANALLRGLGVDASLSSSIITDDFLNLQGNQRLPLALVINHTYPFSNVTLIALDDAVPINPGNLTVIAETSSSSEADGVKGPFPVVVMGNVYNGTVILISSPAIFINALINVAGNGELLRAICQMGNAAYLPILLRPIDVSYVKLAAWIMVNNGLFNIVIVALIFIILALPIIHLIMLNERVEVAKDELTMVRLMMPIIYIALNLGEPAIVYIASASLLLLIIDAIWGSIKSVNLSLTLTHIPLTALLIPRPWSPLALIPLIILYHRQLSHGIEADWRALILPYPAASILALLINHWLSLMLALFSTYLIALTLLKKHKLGSIRLRAGEGVVLTRGSEFTLRLVGRLKSGVTPVIHANGSEVEEVKMVDDGVVAKFRLRSSEPGVHWLNIKTTLIDNTRIFKVVRSLGQVTVVTLSNEPIVDATACNGTILIIPITLSPRSAGELILTVLQLVEGVAKSNCGSSIVIYDEFNNTVKTMSLAGSVDYYALVKQLLSELEVINAGTLVKQVVGGTLLSNLSKVKSNMIMRMFYEFSEPIIVVGDDYFTKPIIDELSRSKLVIYMPITSNRVINA